MDRKFFLALALGLTAIASIPATVCKCDEGMFLFSNPPKEKVAQKYNFEITQDWLDKAMLSAVRFNNGGSGGFVSSDGLVITKHHIADSTLAQLSTAQCDYLAKGFLAHNRSEELKAPNLELNCLQKIEDVTQKVNEGVTPKTPASKASEIRAKNIERIEKEAKAETGLRCDVVTLYQGGQYHLYSYKKYTDVRLVWAPEQASAAFGGDADNFEYPRTSLDAALFRVYENDQPVHPKNYFKIDPHGPQEGDLVFVVGHPGHTNRLETYAQVDYRRNRALPYNLARCRTMEAAYQQFAQRSLENARRVNDDIHSVANSRKAYTGMFKGLCSDEIMQRKQNMEDELRQQASQQKPWEDIADIYANLDNLEETYSLLEGKDAYPSPLFSIARHLVRLAQEKADDKYHLPEYAPAKLDSLYRNIFSDYPIYSDVEKARLSASFSFLAERLGLNNPDVKLVLQGQTPEDRASQLIDGCQLFDPAQREKLSKLSLQELSQVNDPMIQLAIKVDERSRQLRKLYSDKVKSPLTQAYTEIAQERFKAYGDSVPPDATFTLRLSYGVVKGYEDEEQKIPWSTNIGDLYRRASEHQNTYPYKLAPSWEKAQKKLNMSAPVDFVATSDTIGGNSGSPVINKAGRMIGLNFDRNQFGMVRNFVYDETKARHISVATPVLLQALRYVYGADYLAEELSK